MRGEKAFLQGDRFRLVQIRTDRRSACLQGPRTGSHGAGSSCLQNASTQRGGYSAKASESPILRLLSRTVSEKISQEGRITPSISSSVLSPGRGLVMSLKAAHLVLIQFGIFIGIVICLAFSRFESFRPRTTVEMREPAAEHAATGERMAEPEDEFADVADNREMLQSDDSLTEQPAAAMPNAYSPEAVEKSMAILTKLYYEQIAPRRTVSSIPANTGVAPSYNEVAPEPDVVQTEDPAPQTVTYVQPTQVIVYPQPVVVFSNSRRFVNRCRPAPHPSALASHSHRRQDSRATHSRALPESRPARSFGLEQRGTIGVTSFPSTQGFTPRGKR